MFLKDISYISVYNIRKNRVEMIHVINEKHAGMQYSCLRDNSYIEHTVKTAYIKINKFIHKVMFSHTNRKIH